MIDLKEVGTAREFMRELSLGDGSVTLVIEASLLMSNFTLWINARIRS
jgi:hypothetical protein